MSNIIENGEVTLARAKSTAISLPDEDFEKMIKAARNGKWHRLQQLLKQPKNLEWIDYKKPGDFGYTILMTAILNGHDNIVSLLLNKGANGNLKMGMHDFTSLMVASQAGDLEIVKMLLDHGADPSITNRRGKTALYDAIDSNRTDIVVEFLRRDGDLSKIPFMSDLICHAAFDGNMKILAILTHYGLDIHAPLGDDCDTPLIAAVLGGCYFTVEWLIQHGVRVNEQDEMGNSAIHYAIMNDRYEIRDLLLRNDARLRTDSSTIMISPECQNDSCTICMEDFESDEAVEQLRCNHNFHPGCIREWLMEKITCPVCRQ